MAVGLEAEGFDFGDTLDALAVQLVFDGQYGLLKQCYRGGGCAVQVRWVNRLSDRRPFYRSLIC
jgi:hypothetical protein